MKRNPCYCGKISKETMKKDGIPEGYCGLCEMCNKPGHTQHFPGAVPYTGTWCDDCLKKIARKQHIKEFCTLNSSYFYTDNFVSNKTSMNFRPGFRISIIDILVLVAGALSAIYYYAFSQVVSLVIIFVIGHFFIFCNITRMSRIPELIWGGTFLLFAGFSASTGQPSWLLTFLLSILITFILVLLEARKPSYHGIFWQALNPNLPRWFEKNHTSQ